MSSRVLTSARGPAMSPVARLLTRGPLHVVLVVVGLLWLLPSVGLLVSSFRPSSVVSSTGWWMAFLNPLQFTLSNYGYVLGRANMALSFANSLVIAIPAIVMPILIVAFGVYVFAWMKFLGCNVL
ncbi:MAG TPA: carbohydrate ABC transporter permease, partial [Spirochaetia bacterium]|nr:carbohydrate ABC transporter permease [Spirochaetia bacterium]